MSTVAPSVALVFGAVSPPQVDVVELLVHLGCSKEVGSYEVKLHNFEGKFSPGGVSPITVGLDGSISLGRGATCPLLMTIRVEDVNYESSPTENYIILSGRCWGERLFRRVVTATYTGMTGEEIVKDLMDYYAGLSHTRGGTELVEATDTTYSTLEYADSPVWDILKYIAETSDKAGIIGFDFRVGPDGKFEFFPKLSKTNGVTIVDNIDGLTRYRKNITRIRNKVTIYGLADKTIPTDKVSWTRSLAPVDGDWAAVSGSVSVDFAGAPDGGACIMLDVAGALYYGSCVFTLDADKAVNAELYPFLNVQFRLVEAYSGTGIITLWDSDSKVASKSVSVSPDGSYHVFEVGVGSAYVNQWDSVEAGFDWTSLSVIRFTFWFAESVGEGVFWVHGLYFGGRRFSAVAQDAASQAAYGLREYVETDEEIWSDAECTRRAAALLAYLKDPAEYLTLISTVLDFGGSPVLAGDLVHVHLPVEGVDGDFRVESVEYHVPAGESVLEVRLELGKEPPKLADYIYGLRAFTVNVEKLSRTKVGKRGVPVATGGGGGGGSGSVFYSNVEIDKKYPVVNLLTGRVLRAAFGFDDANVFVVSYVGDLILRAQSKVVRPYADGSDDLGAGAFRFNKLFLKDSLHLAGFEVVTNARVLQNVTLNASVITGGEIDINRLPRSDLGKIIEAQGAGFYPMYVDPNGRYSPGAHSHDYAPLVHSHSAGDITSGGVTEDVAVAKDGGGVRTLHFVNSKYTGYTDS